MRAASITNAITDDQAPGDFQALAAKPGLRLTGFSVAEVASSPDAASFILHHGDDATGTVIGWFVLAASEFQTHVIGDRGIAVDGGVFVELLSGEVALSLWHTVG